MIVYLFIELKIVRRKKTQSYNSKQKKIEKSKS